MKGQREGGSPRAAEAGVVLVARRRNQQAVVVIVDMAWRAPGGRSIRRVDQVVIVVVSVPVAMRSLPLGNVDQVAVLDTDDVLDGGDVVEGGEIAGDKHEGGHRRHQGA